MLNTWRRVSLLIVFAAGVCAKPHAGVAQDQNPPPMEEESPFLTEPTTAEALLESVVLMQRFGNSGLAKRYLKNFIALQPNDATLLKLRDQYGPAAFLKLANDRALQPESIQLSNQITEVFRKRGADPARISKLINDLAGGPRERAVALETLRSAGDVVVPEILNQLDAADTNKKSSLITALIQMGQPVVPPLMGALESPKENIRQAAINILGYLGGEQEMPYLWRPAFGPNESINIQQVARRSLTKVLKKPQGNRPALQVSPYGSAAEIKRVALTHYRNEFVWPMKKDEKTVKLWTWNPQTNLVASVDMSPQAASLYRGGQLARDAMLLAPEDSEAQALFLGFALGNDALRAGLGAPLPNAPNSAFQLGLSSGANVVSDTLAQALANKNPIVAVAALQVLAQNATQSQLYGGNKSASLLAALNYPDQRVQFAAAVAVLQLDPNRPFAEANRVVEILQRSLGNSGGPAALVIDPNPQRGNNVGGMLQEMGFRGQPITRQTGQSGFQAAVERNDVEVIAIQANVTEWTLTQTLANFRSDARTANLPILIYGPDWSQANVQKLVKRTPRTGFVLESVTGEFFGQQVEPLMNSFQLTPLSEQERDNQAQAGAYWLAHIARGRRTAIFSIDSAETALSRSIENPALAGNALQALGAIPTKTAQQRLQAVTANKVYELPLREQAAYGLAFHIQRHGVLLTSEQIREVLAVKPLPSEQELSSALASIAGSLKPNSQAVSSKLQQFQIPNPLQP